MTTNDLQDISTLLEMGARLEAVELVHPTTVSFQVLLTFSIKAKKDDLKPCPFCDGHASMEMDGSCYCASCDDCGATGARMYDLMDAAKAWNRRAGDERD